MTEKRDRQTEALADPDAEASPEAIEDLEVQGDEDVTGGVYLRYTMTNVTLHGVNTQGDSSGSSSGQSFP
jgi:hypothetical protein